MQHGRGMEPGSEAHIWVNFEECRVRMLKLVDMRVDAAMMA